MDNALFLDFYRSFYNKTDGFIPAKPLPQALYPGDFFQIKKGQMVLLGNIFHNRLIEPEDGKLRYGLRLKTKGWDLDEGVISSRYLAETWKEGASDEKKYARHSLTFSELGGYYFSASGLEAVKLSNWNEIKEHLIIRFTQTHYSFRELYVVTETAFSDHWLLAVAKKEARLDMSVEAGLAGDTDIIRHPLAQVRRLHNIHLIRNDPNQKTCFFKAKKLVVHHEQADLLISELIEQQNKRATWASSFYSQSPDARQVHSSQLLSAGAAQVNLLDLLQANQLNPNTALLFFDWENANLDDVQKLFPAYA